VTPWENGSLSYVVTNHVKAVAFGSQKSMPCSDQRRRKPHRGPGKTFDRRAQLGIKFKNFFFLKRHILVYFIF